MTHQLENGYTRIANTLLEALAASDMTSSCFRVILWVWRNSYGFNRKACKPVTIRALSEELVMSKSSVHEALLVLISQGIITRTEAGFVFVKSKLHEFVRPTGQEILSGPSDTLSGPPDKTVRPTGQANNTITKDRERNPKDIAFDSFWKVYPRKTGKGAAFASWKKKTPPLDKCLRTLSLLVQTDQWRREEGRFIPHPATWLNQERWDDVPEGYKEFTCCGCGYVGKVRSGYKGAAKCPECSATTMV